MLEVRARVCGQFGGLYRIEGEVTATVVSLRQVASRSAVSARDATFRLWHARRATGAPAGAERGSRGPASDGEGGSAGRNPPDLG